MLSVYIRKQMSNYGKKLKSSSITKVYDENGSVFTYSDGHIFCLNASNGSTVWEAPLKAFDIYPFHLKLQK
jgi:outer membrane protein assembly factor BamB